MSSTCCTFTVTGHYYESHGPRDHIHVACLRCGKVREVESDLFEQLKRQVERDTGIDITVARVEIGGYCDGCRPKTPAPGTSS